jgi:hypothetical protein
MPYSKKSCFYHKRQKQPNLFDESTFKTVPLDHTEYKGTKFQEWSKKDSGAKAIVGKLKKNGKWRIQSILIPKGNC